MKEKLIGNRTIPSKQRGLNHTKYYNNTHIDTVTVTNLTENNIYIFKNKKT